MGISVCAFPLISLPFMPVSGPIIYQIKAEYQSYSIHFQAKLQ